MRGMNYTKASRVTDTRVPSNSFLTEALAIQAAKRPAKTPPRLMPVTPTLPKVAKVKRRRRTI